MASQGIQSMIHQYDMFIYISSFKIENDIIYYRISYGRISNVINLKYMRFSELRSSGFNLDSFPPRTLFNYTDTDFINSRISKLNLWIRNVIEDNKGYKLLDYISNFNR